MTSPAPRLVTFGQPHPFPGKLIIVEGIDGSGKSTQLLLLQKWLEAQGFNVFFTEWNSSDLVKETTRKGKKTKSLTPTTFSLLHATDFASRLYHHILPPLKAGMIVLADRYAYTAIARLLGGTRGQFKYYEAGMDMGLSQDVTESFRIFQSRILSEYDKIVDEYHLTVMDATKEIEEQQDDMRAVVTKALEHYKPKRGGYGKRAAVFWRRFGVPQSE